MSDKDRKRFEQTGKVFRDGKLVSVKTIERARKIGVSALTARSTSSQVRIMAEALHTGRLSIGKLRKALEDNAPKEMGKGAKKLLKKHKEVTVDALLVEYCKDEEFQNLAAEVGLDAEWFVKVAENECRKWKGVA